MNKALRELWDRVTPSQARGQLEVLRERVRVELLKASPETDAEAA